MVCSGVQLCRGNQRCAYSYIFLDAEFVVRSAAELLVALLGYVQIAQGAAQLSCLLAQLPVSLLQLLLPEQDGLHLLLTQSLLFPDQDSLY